MTDRTNECPNHSLIAACTADTKDRLKNHIFDHGEMDIQMAARHKDLWDSIKTKVSELTFYWVIAGVFVAMLFLFSVNRDAISEVDKNSHCTEKTVIRIEKKVDRIALEMKLKNWDDINWGE